LIAEDIARGLWANFQAQKPVTMINMFQGVPVIHDATLALVSREYVVFTIRGVQAACVALEKRAYLQSEFLPGVVRGQSVSVDVPHGEVILTRFMTAGINFTRRLHLRVQPKDSVRVHIHTQLATFTGSLADLSAQGLGVYTFGAYIAEQMGLDRNKSATLEIHLPLVDQVLELKGKVVTINQEKFTSLNRCGIEIVADPAAEAILQEFIQKRKDQIMQDLERTYLSMCVKANPA
jgi:hypothetical protein